MKTGYRVLLAACIGFGLMLMVLQWAQAKDSDTSPLTPSDACIFQQGLISILEETGETTEEIVVRCDQVAHTDPVYVDAAANIVERSARRFCTTTGPAHKANCLSESRQRNHEVWAESHRENERIRQQIRGGRR